MHVPANTHVLLHSEYVSPGTYEIQAEVQWDSSVEGHRFFHVKHGDDSPPTVSEAIEAGPLQAISKGKQTMRGWARIPKAVKLYLEVWSDHDAEVLDFTLNTLIQ